MPLLTRKIKTATQTIRDSNNDSDFEQEANAQVPYFIDFSR
ncbi:MAG: hypothetical protein ACI9NY_001090 [Kiritimatiellia bacterium]|jgi:hypothetical protein